MSKTGREGLPGGLVYRLELTGSQVAAEQVAERDAVQAVAHTGDREVVVVGVHVAHHLADVEEAGDGAVIGIAHLGVDVGVEAGLGGHEHGVVHGAAEGARLIDARQVVGVLTEVLRDSSSFVDVF